MIGDEHASRPLREVRVLLARAMMRRRGGDDVAHPPQEATGANPQARGDDQPEDAAKEISVVELSDAWDQEA